MGDKLKTKIEINFQDLEERLETCPQMTLTDKRNELKKLEAALNDLDKDIQRYQMTAGTRNQETYEQFDERFTELTAKFNQINSFDTMASTPVIDRMEESSSNNTHQAQILEADSKLKEGKSKALAMLHTINNMREEINLIDDEIMIQREKLLVVNQKLKDTQSVLKQTKRLVAFFSKAVYDDVFIKVMIGLIAVALVVILGMSINIKIKKGNIEKLKAEKLKALIGNPNFNQINEQLFLDLTKNKNVPVEAGAFAKAGVEPPSANNNKKLNKI